MMHTRLLVSYGVGVTAALWILTRITKKTFYRAPSPVRSLQLGCLQRNHHGMTVQRSLHQDSINASEGWFQDVLSSAIFSQLESLLQVPRARNPGATSSARLDVRTVLVIVQGRLMRLKWG